MRVWTFCTRSWETVVDGWLGSAALQDLEVVKSIKDTSVLDHIRGESPLLEDIQPLDVWES
jgi:hypothetical protein